MHSFLINNILLAESAFQMHSAKEHLSIDEES